MKYQQKLPKSIKILFTLLLIYFILSCSKDKTNGVLYYFEQKDMFTNIEITCNELRKYTGLRKIQLTDKEIHELLIRQVKDVPSVENCELDVRYKIKIDEDIFCIDYSGCFLLNGEQMGKINFVDKIDKFISNNKNRSVEVTKPTPKPWAVD